MPLPEELARMLSSGAALLATGALVWTWRLRPVAQARRAPALPPPAPWPAVSIIVPARNEAHNLPVLLSSLARLQPAAAEIIVVDDHSSDGTATVAFRHGATVVTAPPLPPGWLGKPWACATGARAARGQHLLFTDADTVHAPSSLGAAVATLDAAAGDGTRAGLVSLLPSHQTVTRWERCQGVFQLLLLLATRARAFGTAARTDDHEDDRGERRFCIGQYLLFRRATYDRIGGHAAVRDRVAEDLAFARLVTGAGAHYRLLGSADLLAVRMYPEGLRASVRGWRRNLREGLTAAGVGGFLEVALAMAALLGPPLWTVRALLSGNAIAAALAGVAWLAATWQVARRQHLVLHAPQHWTALTYPLFATLFALTAVLATMDRIRHAPVTWRGRSLALEDRARTVD